MEVTETEPEAKMRLKGLKQCGGASLNGVGREQAAPGTCTPKHCSSPSPDSIQLQQQACPAPLIQVLYRAGSVSRGPLCYLTTQPALTAQEPHGSGQGGTPFPV